MDINRLFELLAAWPFRQAVWLFPLATAFHFLEEAPHVADWASKHALAGYTRQSWRRIHGLGMVFAIAFCALASIFPNRYVVFLFFALCLSDSVMNGLVPCECDGVFWRLLPGSHHFSCLVSPTVLVPQPTGLSRGLMTNAHGLVAFLIAAVINTMDVAMSVFGVKLQSHRDTS